MIRQSAAGWSTYRKTMSQIPSIRFQRAARTTTERQYFGLPIALHRENGALRSCCDPLCDPAKRSPEAPSARHAVRSDREHIKFAAESQHMCISEACRCDQLGQAFL